MFSPITELYKTTVAYASGLDTNDSSARAPDAADDADDEEVSFAWLPSSSLP